jgi:hypothetical protein
VRAHEAGGTPLDNAGRTAGGDGCAEIASVKAGPGRLRIRDAQEEVLMRAGRRRVENWGDNGGRPGKDIATSWPGGL